MVLPSKQKNLCFENRLSSVGVFLFSLVSCIKENYLFDVKLQILVSNSTMPRWSWELPSKLMFAHIVFLFFFQTYDMCILPYAIHSMSLSMAAGGDVIVFIVFIEQGLWCTIHGYFTKKKYKNIFIWYCLTWYIIHEICKAHWRTYCANQIDITGIVSLWH